jgi:hypothetical protein
MLRVKRSRVVWAKIMIGLQVLSLQSSPLLAATPWSSPSSLRARTAGVSSSPSTGNGSGFSLANLLKSLPFAGRLAAAFEGGGQAPGDPCASPANSIVAENCQPGTPQLQWDVNGAGDPSIQGFATDISVNQGETVHFKINVNPAVAYHLDIYRMGYYGGMGARKITTTPIAPIAVPQPQPACTNDPSVGLTDCGNWLESASWDVPANATSGIYFARVYKDVGSADSHIFFIVRNDTGHSAVLFQTSDPTWQAYNRYGGSSFYFGNPVGRGYKLSYNRPFDTRNHDPQSFVFGAEYPMVRWLEANGYDVSYTTGVDTDRRGAEIQEHKVFLSVGHDEYWSAGQRTSVENARAAGVNLGFFSGNEIFWKTRWENSIDGSNAPYRTLVSYKETWNNAKIDPSPLWTGTWRDGRFSSDGGKPENALTGTLFQVDNQYESRSIVVNEAEGKMRFWRNTAAAALAPGASLILPQGRSATNGTEPTGFRPAGIQHRRRRPTRCRAISRTKATRSPPAPSPTT